MVQAGLPSPVPQEACVGVQEAHPSWHLGLWARGDPGHLSATSTDAKTCGPGKQQRPVEGVPLYLAVPGWPCVLGNPRPSSCQGDQYCQGSQRPRGATSIK